MDFFDNCYTSNIEPYGISLDRQKQNINTVDWALVIVVRSFRRWSLKKNILNLHPRNPGNRVAM